MLIGKLWTSRDRYPLGTRMWARAWAKRLQQTRALLRQSQNQRWLTRNGVSIGEFAWIVSTVGFSGKLSNLHIGAESFVGRVTIAAHDRVNIGNRVCINDGAQLLTASHDIHASDWATKSAPIDIGDFAWIATNAIILPGVKLGVGAVVGAGSVVATDVPDYGVAIGNRSQLHARKRQSALAYSPVSFTALYRAWCSHSMQPSVATTRVDSVQGTN